MKKIFSLILSLAMLLTITSGLNLTAYADSSQYGNIYYEEKELIVLQYIANLEQYYQKNVENV